MQKTKSSSIGTTYRGQRDLHYRKEILHLEGKEIFKYFQSSYKTFQRHSRHSSCKTFQGHSRHSSHSWHSAIPGNSSCFQNFQALLHTSRDSTLLQHSPARMHVLHFNWFPQRLHWVPVETLQTFQLHSSKKGRCCDISQNWHILQNRIQSSFCLVKWQY